MEIEILKENGLVGQDSGGGCRQVMARIYIDPSLHPRVQRKALVHEVLGCCLDYTFTQRQLERLEDTLTDALDQLEPL